MKQREINGSDDDEVDAKHEQQSDNKSMWEEILDEKQEGLEHQENSEELQGKENVDPDFLPNKSTKGYQF